MTVMLPEAPAAVLDEEVSLLGSALHRSRNITLSMRAYAELIADVETTATKREEWARRILGQLDRLDDMYERMENLRPSDTTPGQISLALALRTAHSRLQRKTQALPRVRLDLDVDPLIRADAEDLTRALAELIQNASDAATPSGEVVVQILREKQGTWCLRITDDGPGLDETTRERVGEPFFSRKPGHLGLGVFTSRTLLERQGLDLFLVDRPEGGAVAIIRQQALTTGGIR